MTGKTFPASSEPEEQKNRPVIKSADITEEQKTCRRAALSILEYKSRTEEELRKKLLSRGFSPALTDDAIEYAASFGYINDLRYAETYILNRMDQKSRQKIIMELAGKGISRSTAEEAWENIAPEERDERELLLSELKKKLPDGRPPDEKEKRRLYAYFQRRGFRTDDILSAMDRLGE